jgi:TolB-like protein
MKNMVLRFWVLLVMISAIAFGEGGQEGLYGQEPQGQLPRLAVVEFDVNANVPKVNQDSVTVRNLVESQMVATRKYQVITRTDIDRLLANQQIQVSSISSAENIRKLQLQNISYIVTGSVDALGDDYAVTLRILDVSTGQFNHSANAFMGSGSRDIYQGVTQLASSFAGGMTSQGGQVAQSAQQPGAGTYKIGDRGPSGGWVFYDKGVVSAGWRYLEAAGVHAEFTAPWADAVRRADSLVVDGYDNWRLPNKGELDLMYKNLRQKGLGDFSDTWYWSSSEGGSSSAWYQYFSAGSQFNGSKADTRSVRAVRAF